MPNSPTILKQHPFLALLLFTHWRCIWCVTPCAVSSNICSFAYVNNENAPAKARCCRLNQIIRML